MCEEKSVWGVRRQSKNSQNVFLKDVGILFLGRGIRTKSRQRKSNGRKQQKKAKHESNARTQKDSTIKQKNEKANQKAKRKAKQKSKQKANQKAIDVESGCRTRWVKGKQ